MLANDEEVEGKLAEPARSAGGSLFMGRTLAISARQALRAARTALKPVKPHMVLTKAVPSPVGSILATHDEPAREALRVPLPWQPSHQQELAIVIPDVLSQEECEAIIRACERVGFEEALLNVGNGQQVRAPNVRKSNRCIIDDVCAAEQLFERVKPFLPAEHTIIRGGTTWHCVGLNERLRVLKYEPGDYFAPHTDGRYVRVQGDSPVSKGERGDTSFFTMMFYLNTPTRGGNTNFMNARDQSEVSPVDPKTGWALCFDHGLMHEGALLEAGVKYCIRTDVMFRRESVAATGERHIARNVHTVTD